MKEVLLDLERANRDLARAINLQTYALFMAVVLFWLLFYIDANNLLTRLIM